ncbi:hypothetical protein LSCM4_03420 [Leishmania orientalis]|uniref:Cyclase n=1 Tax=Leishmania orientalis TaxID=2249476 RepID=A0A836KIF6_9TRYP|nr:hypothetical protein LSCM4_03420 [Leishmania orientalis]
MRLVDLSLPLYDGMPVYNGDPQARVTKVCTREKNGWEVRQLQIDSHTGTHVDAPIHMHEGGSNLDEIPLTRFCGRAVVATAAAPSFPPNTGLLFHEAVPAECVPRIVSAKAPFVRGPLEEAERLLPSHRDVSLHRPRDRGGAHWRVAHVLRTSAAYSGRRWLAGARGGCHRRQVGRQRTQ